MKRSLSLPVAAIGAIVLGAAGFGAGFVVRAADDDPSSSNPSGAAVDLPAIAPSMGMGNTPAYSGGQRDIKLAAEDGDYATSSGAGYAPNSTVMPSCTSDLPATITASGIDLAAAGFVVKPLGSAFVPVSFAVRSVGACEYDGNGLPKPEEPGKIVVDTTWRHIETQVQVTVSQQLADDTVANVIRNGQASFTSGGYTFQVYANVYYYAGVKDGVVPPELSSRSSEPAFAPGEPDPRTEAVIMAAIKDLAPDFSDQCFAREVKGDWADLAKFGLGDPRPAIPSGVELQNMSLVYTNPAPQDCGGADLTADRNLQFSANWYSDDKTGTNVSIYAGGMGANPGQPFATGQVSENSATWVSNNISFSIYGNRNSGGLGLDTIRAIAKALDPSYDEKCFITQLSFKGDKLGDFGVNKPVLPSGYKVTDENGTSFDLADGCPKPEGYVDDGFSYWAQYENGENYISVGLDRSPYSKGDPGTGYAGPGNLYFVTGDGVMVSISGYSRKGGNEGPSLDDLKAVAKSIDPGVDFDKLESGNGGGIPVPMPAATDSSGGATGR